MLNHTYQIADTIGYKANTTVDVDIPETGYITEIILLMELEVTPSSIVSREEDALARIIDSMKITAAGGKNYFNVDDGRQAYWLAHHQYQGQLLHDRLPGAGEDEEVVRILLPIHFGLDPFDPFDKSIIIPAAELSNLKLEVTWGSASNLGTGFSIDEDDSRIRIIIRELTLERGETRESIFPGGLNVPLFESRTTDLDSTKSNLSETDDVPVGSMLHSVLIMIEDSGDDRSDIQISEIGTKYPKLALEEYRIDNMYALKGMNRKQFLLPGTHINQAGSNGAHYLLDDPAGIFLFRFEEVTGRAIGMDLSTAMTGDVKLGFTVIATGGKYYLLYRSIALG